MTRRDITTLLPALAWMSAALGDAQTNEATAPLKLHSGVFQFAKLPVHNSSGGAATRPILDGKLPTGELVEMHETTLLPGQMPHPAHRHVHTEFMLVREGSVELILDGKSEQAGPGDVVYAASNELHGLKNIGTAPANYFVIAIGPQSKAS